MRERQVLFNHWVDGNHLNKKVSENVKRFPLEIYESN